MYVDDMENVTAVQKAITDMGFQANSQMEWIEPVSYTHLDVYKRQLVICPDARPLKIFQRMQRHILTSLRNISRHQ